MPVVKLEKNKENQKKLGLLKGNPVYKPFRYPWCYDAWLTQQRIHWLPEEVPLGDDVRDGDEATVVEAVVEKYVKFYKSIFCGSVLVM